MKNKQLHCTSIDCRSRRSKCCDRPEEINDYYVIENRCSFCKRMFIPGDHSCGIVDPTEMLQEIDSFLHNIKKNEKTN